MQSTNKPQYKLSELVKGLDVTIKGDPDCVITGICPLQQSQPGYISFLNNSLYRKYLPTTQAAAVILSAQDAEACTVNAVVSPDPYFIYSQIAHFFVNQSRPEPGIHPTVVMGTNCSIDPSASIGPHCVIGNHVRIAANVVIGPGSCIEDGCDIGDDTQLDAHVMVYHHSRIGKRGRITSGVVIGSDGFGLANHKGTWHKIPQLGGVEIGDDVDIGANTTIDRGAIENTIIENGVKLDNLIQIGHNVRIGANTIIAGCVAIAGSTVIGKNCVVGGATCFAGHLHICDNAMFTGMTAVTKSITEPGVYSSGIVGAVPNAEFRKNNARFHRLGKLIQRVKALEVYLKQ